MINKLVDDGYSSPKYESEGEAGEEESEGERKEDDNESQKHGPMFYSVLACVMVITNMLIVIGMTYQTNHSWYLVMNMMYRMEMEVGELKQEVRELKEIKSDQSGSGVSKLCTRALGSNGGRLEMQTK